MSIFNKVTKTFQWGQHTVTMETGEVARQSTGAVLLDMDGTVVLATVVGKTEGKPGQDFFPLTVDYREKFAAAGRFPGSYFRREGKPSDKEILTSRLCDRPLRPLFPEGFLNEVQVIGLLLSADQINDSDILMVNGASAALLCSDIPWNGPIAGVRVGRIEGRFVINPTHEEQYNSDLDLIYVGNENDMMMIEGSADQLPEADFIAALEYAQKAIQPIIAAQRKLAAMYSKTKRVFPLVVCEPKALAICERVAGEGDQLKKAIFLASKKERGDAVKAVVEKAKAACKAELGDVFDARPAQGAPGRLGRREREALGRELRVGGGGDVREHARAAHRGGRRRAEHERGGAVRDRRRVAGRRGANGWSTRHGCRCDGVSSNRC